MKLIKKDYKKGIVKLEIQNLDDLWYLSTIIDQGDYISSSTERKIKLGGEDQRKSKVIIKKVWLTIDAEKIQFSKTTNALRISGKITEGKEDIASGDYHTLSLDLGNQIEINKGKKGFLSYQIDKIKEACKNTATRILICALDRDEAILAVLKKYGYEIITSLSGESEKKDYKQEKTKNFFNELTKILDQTIDRMKINTLVVGSVAFWKDNLAKEINKTNIKNKCKIIYTSCSSDKSNAINEIMKKQEVKSALQDERYAIETNLIAQILSAISKDEKVEYGIAHVENASNLGAIEKLLVSDELIRKSREENNYQKIDDIMRTVDKSQGEIFIISSEHEGGEQLNGLGGIAALLRFQI